MIYPVLFDFLLLLVLSPLCLLTSWVLESKSTSSYQIAYSDLIVPRYQVGTYSTLPVLTADY